MPLPIAFPALWITRGARSVVDGAGGRGGLGSFRKNRIAVCPVPIVVRKIAQTRTKCKRVAGLASPQPEVRPTP